VISETPGPYGPLPDVQKKAKRKKSKAKDPRGRIDEQTQKLNKKLSRFLLLYSVGSQLSVVRRNVSSRKHKTSKVPTIMSEQHNFALRYGSLGLLVAQDTALVLLLRSSRENKHDEGPMYLASTAVFCMETLKLFSCAIMIFRGVAANDMHRWWHIVSKEVLEPWEMAKLSLPAILYLLQNNLLYFALSHLRATPYKVTYNLKILTGAFFSVTMLGQRLGPRKWGALGVLMMGVSIVQLMKHENMGSKVAESNEPDRQFIGFCAVFAAAVTSGFCGVSDRYTASCFCCLTLALGVPTKDFTTRRRRFMGAECTNGANVGRLRPLNSSPEGP
jgi:hypothetical protein